MQPKRVKLLGIQSGLGAGTAGAQRGPTALRARGLVDRLREQGHHVEDLGDIPGVHQTRYAASTDTFIKNLPNVLQVNRHTHAAVLGTRRRHPDDFLLIVGGDHSIAIGTLAGLADSCERLGLLWIDAHADFNTPETSPSGNIHGMSLAVACGYGVLDLRRIATCRPFLREEDAYLYGVRDIDEREGELLAGSAVNVLTAEEFRAAGVARATVAAAEALATRCDHIHVSFDIDSLDASEVPGTGTPVPGGLTGNEAEELLWGLSQRDLIHSIEFVEYNPTLDQDERTADVTLRLIRAMFQVP